MEMIHIKYHDLKHQITGLRAISDANEREEWINKLESELEENQLPHETGNKVLDTILGAKLFSAKQVKARLTIVADGSILSFMHVTDICTIFGNALDNAIECVAKIEEEEKRLIHLTVAKKKGFAAIDVSNYLEEEIDLSAQEGLPKTKKADKTNHGYGLKSIKYTVDKYDGTMSIDTKDGWFELHIWIPLEE